MSPHHLDKFADSFSHVSELAVGVFACCHIRPFVPWYKRSRFDKAWLRFRSATGREVDAQCYHHYLAFSGQPDSKATFRINVDGLLSFSTDL